MNKRIVCSMIFNFIIFVTVLIGTLFMVTGFKFMSSAGNLTSTGWAAFKYFTVDSNIVVGVVAFIMFIYELLYLSKRIEVIPQFVYILKHIGTVGVILTFVVTLFYLAPLLGSKFLFLYQNTNLLFHLIVPIFSFVSFVFFEKTKIDFKYTFYGLSTMVLYGIYYIGNIIIHLDNGVVNSKYDWYGFMKLGLLSIFIVVPIMMVITYFISWLLFRLNKLK